MSWLIDNSSAWFVLLGIVAAGFAAAWWLRRTKPYLLGLGITVAVIALLWLLTQLIVTDRKQIESNVHAMADAAITGKADILLNHFSGDFTQQGKQGRDLAEAAIRGAKNYKLNDIVIRNFTVDDLTANSAKASFLAYVHHGAADAPGAIPFLCKTTFVKEGNHWKLKDIEIRTYPGNQPYVLPIP